MSRGLKHFWNDQCTRVLRNFPYPIRQKVKGFPAKPSQDGGSVVAVLCGSRQFLEGLWSLWSWMWQISPRMGAVMLFDGQATPAQHELFRKLFPGGRLLELEPFLNGRPLPDYLRRFVAGNWTAKKLAAVYELQKESNVLYSDSDVLCFQKPDEIIQAIQVGYAAYLHDEIGYTLDPWLSAKARKMGVSATNQFNAGLVYVPQGGLKDELLAEFLSDWQPAFNSHHAEQTLFSILFEPGQMRPLSPDRHVLSWQGVWVSESDLDCSQIVCRHYVGPIRHRMYLTAYPFLLRQVRDGADNWQDNY